MNCHRGDEEVGIQTAASHVTKKSAKILIHSHCNSLEELGIISVRLEKSDPSWKHTAEGRSFLETLAHCHEHRGVEEIGGIGLPPKSTKKKDRERERKEKQGSTFLSQKYMRHG